MAYSSHDIGNQGERAAELLLSNSGMQVLQRNWRKGIYEIDLVCREDEMLVFVEVRTRKFGGVTRPEETITETKRRNMIRAAQAYLLEYDLWECSCRFDVVCVIVKGKNLELEHYRHVCEFSETMDSCNTSWKS